MSAAGQRFEWTLHLRAAPAALWPYVSNTDRFNRECGLPAFERVAAPAGAAPGVRRLRARYLGLEGVWDEQPFEWVELERFSVSRRFVRGPVRRIDQSLELQPDPAGGTRLIYRIEADGKGIAGWILVAFGVGWRMRRSVERLMLFYDTLALRTPAGPGAGPSFHPDPARMGRIEALARQSGQSTEEAARLLSHLEIADETSAARMRPFALARHWGSDRGRTLDLFLHATRAGMLDLRWEVLCPHCRGAEQAVGTLEEVSSEGRCESCGVDFEVNFDRSVELTFSPNPSIRRAQRRRFCVGGPQTTPHIVAQQGVGPGEALELAAELAEGGYRVRASGSQVVFPFQVHAGGAARASLVVGDAAPAEEPTVATRALLRFENASPTRRLLVVERTAWADDAVTAAAVSARQAFRDLFSRELLRPGERIAVQSMAFLFTDLKDSTAMYGREGDAAAFGRVLAHFDVLRAEVAREGGAVVKTMGDAVMAVFERPAPALRAAARAQRVLADPARAASALALKCSVHRGPCLAIRQNDRLDYFGTTVNTAARLCSVSTGRDIVTTDAVLWDLDAAELAGERSARDSSVLRGLGGSPFAFWRLSGLTF